MKSKVYFKNLNGLRFIAAMVVLLSHVGPFVNNFNLLNEFSPIFYFPVSGEFGVLLFFALSGFLITYLLLTEVKITDTIKIKDFYIRRALRIWPLYFLTITLALFVFPFVNFLLFKGIDIDIIWSRLPLKIIFYAILIPNIVMDFIGIVPYATHSWTIGAEEQFYFVWPILFKKIRNKLSILLGVIIVYLLVYYLLRYIPYSNKYTDIGFLIWRRYPISCMAIGGVYAYVIFKQNKEFDKIKSIIFSIIFQIAMIALLATLLILDVHFQNLHNEIYSILLGYQVCNFAANPKSIFSLENKIFIYLGKISYGLYMFHPLAIACAIKISVILGYTNIFLLYALAVILAILLASVSFHLFESYFIKRKNKYSVVLSGEIAK